MIDIIKPMVGIFILTILVEGVVEYLGVAVPTFWKPYTAAIFAVVVSLGYGADLPAAFGLHASFWWIGSIFTGLVIGRGSNYVNDIWSRLKVVTGLGIPVADLIQGQPGTVLQPATSTWSRVGPDNPRPEDK